MKLFYSAGVFYMGGENVAQEDPPSDQQKGTIIVTYNFRGKHSPFLSQELFLTWVNQ